MTLQIVTANRLIDGVVVYLNAGDIWSPWIADARTLDNEESADTALTQAHASVGRNEVVDPYLIDVVQEAQTIKPTRYRETIRAKGPSIQAHASSLSSALPGKQVSSGAVAAGTTTTMAFLNGV